MASHSKVLVITLYSGENEFGQCAEQIRNQDHPYIDHETIKFKSNYEAHRELYERIERKRHEYDVFMKIDADMVLAAETVVRDIVSEFDNNSELDHAVFSVRDWASQTDIMGLHAFSDRVSWKSSDEKLFVDPSPNIPGQKKLYWSSPAPVAFHMPEPSDYQAYLFGFHRGLKVVQRGRGGVSIAHLQSQYVLLEGVWKAFDVTNDRKRLLVLVGAEDAFRGNDVILSSKDCYKLDDVTVLLNKYSSPVIRRRWDKKRASYRLFRSYWVTRREYMTWVLRILGRIKRSLGRYVGG